MKFKKHVEIQENIHNFLIIYNISQNNHINEMSKDTINNIKALGKKFGIKIKPSETVFSYFKKFGKGMDELVRITSLYMLTDVRDNKTRKELISDAIDVLKNINKKEIVAFLIQLDKISFGLTSHFRHFFQSILGLEIATYNKWLKDKEYIEKEINNIKIVMKRMSLENSKEMKLLKKFQDSIESMLN